MRVVLGAASAVAILCTVADRLIGHTAVALIAMIVLGTQALLAGTIAAELLRAARLAGRLESRSTVRMVADTKVSVVAGLGSVAFVLGILRPRIFIGEGLLTTLSRDQVCAVLAHERAHVSDRSALRLAVLTALCKLGRARWLTSIAAKRAAELECRADEAAISAGVRPAVLAAAVLRVDSFPAPVAGIGAAPGPRVAALAVAAAGGKRQPGTHAPVEWLLPFSLWAAVPVCIATRVLLAIALGT
jgi:Zn-dependent protease with chaperone function